MGEVISSDAHSQGITAAEGQRSLALGRLEILDTAPEEAYDDLTRLTAELCGTPIALVSLVDGGRLWFKSRVGVDIASTPTSGSFCERAIETGEMVVVSDARLDDRFRGNPLVAGAPWVRFYAGAPLTEEDGVVLGTLCVLDTVPRAISDRQLDHLRALSRQVVAQLVLRRQVGELATSEQRWRDLVIGSPVGIGVTDAAGVITVANPAFCRILGRPEHEVIGHSTSDFVHPDERPLHGSGGSRIDGADHGVLQLEIRFVRPDGEVRWALLTASRTLDGRGEPRRMAHVLDITARRVAEEEVAASERELRALGHVVRHIQTGGDVRQVIVDAVTHLAAADFAILDELEPDGSALRVSNASTPDPVGVVVPLTIPTISAAVIQTGQARFVADAAVGAVTTPELLKLSGCVSFYAAPIRSKETVIGALVVGWAVPVRELGDRRARAVRLLADQAGVALRQGALIDELHAMAMTDALTGLPNRRRWDEHLEQLLAQTGRNHLPVTVALVDLDHFKRYNDTHGHPDGDALIRRFADAARSTIRLGDTLARWGGEEFAVSLPNCPADEADRVLNRLIAVMPDKETCSIGYAVWDGRQSALQLTASADEALYTAKQAGRDRVIGFDPSP